MNEAELAAVVKGIAPVIREYVDKALVQAAGPIVDTIKGAVDPLKARLDALEAKPHVKFTGTYADSKTYLPGDAATRQGALWICTAPTTGAFDHQAWQLAVKKGDAR